MQTDQDINAGDVEVDLLHGSNSSDILLSSNLDDFTPTGLSRGEAIELEHTPAVEYDDTDDDMDDGTDDDIDNELESHMSIYSSYHGGDCGGDPPGGEWNQWSGCQGSGGTGKRSKNKNLNLKAVLKKNSGKILEIKFEKGDQGTYVAVGPNSSNFNSLVGTLISKIPYHYHTWKEVPSEHTCTLYDELQRGVSPIELYRQMRVRNGAFTEPEAAQNYDQMIQMRDDPQNTLTENEIMQELDVVDDVLWLFVRIHKQVLNTGLVTEKLPGKTGRKLENAAGGPHICRRKCRRQNAKDAKHWQPTLSSPNVVAKGFSDDITGLLRRH
ncbi:hypothetical protein QVD17_39230 [Tagetes erecta]|uniref:Uncharacterized protein n=1 Tax=Tagetes erecta TaxID=13708 RepID=A0AAD8NA11_TARER|nr:hypothetical protein QVD17_39230 [Tagetes erecta]